MGIKFTKMHGLGNDFMVIDAVSQSIDINQLPISTLSDRHRGIGFDQCLIVESTSDNAVDFRYRIFNADGHEVGQCGNGARCLALFLKYRGLIHSNDVIVGTPTTQMALRINEDDSVSVSMPPPLFSPQSFPYQTDQKSDAYLFSASDGKTYSMHLVNVGNPHAVLMVDNVDEAPVQTLGKEISEHPDFPEQANVGFAERVSDNSIKLRVYERGCGETQACGSGAVAAAVVAMQFHQLHSPIKVNVTGGELSVRWGGLNKDVYLTGPATFVYEGRLIL